MKNNTGMRFLAKTVNFAYKLHLPFTPTVILAVENYLLKNIEKAKVFLALVDSRALWKIADAKLIYLVNKYVKATPALRAIKKQNFPKGNLMSVAAFKQYFPALDKDSYIKKHTLEELCQGGKLPHRGCLYKSAGTSGAQTLWVEGLDEEFAFDKSIAFLANTLLDTVNHEYIIINCFVLGAWPTGMGVAESARFYGKTANVGTNLKEAVNVLKTMGPLYQYLIAGYPPFVSQLLLECQNCGFDLTKYQIEVITGGEGFTEEWRDDLIKICGKAKTISSVYGSTDKGLGEGIETSLAYLVRSLLYLAATILLDKNQARKIMMARFGNEQLPFSEETAKQFLLAFLRRLENIQRLPMVFQFDPTNYYNENFIYMDPEQNREVSEFFTTMLYQKISIPRVRYNVHDEGFIMTYEEVKKILDAYKISIDLFNPRQDQYIDLHLPFLFIFGRSDGTISVDGANIFPEDVEECLRANELFFDKINSFQMFVSPDHRLGVAVELKDDIAVEPDQSKKLEIHLKENLANYSFGYNELFHERLRSAEIVAQIHAFGQGPFKDRLVKFRYTKRN